MLEYHSSFDDKQFTFTESNGNKNYTLPLIKVLKDIDCLAKDKIENIFG